MPAPFNADEVFEIACRIERNGARFYRKAAACENDDSAAALLDQLASMEDHHLEVFRSMRTRLAADAPRDWEFDFRDQAEGYLQAVADGKVFDTTDPAGKLTGDETTLDIVNMAIDIEKESIVYYTGIQSVMPEELGREDVAEIIRQELSHLAILTGLKARLEQ